MVSPSERLARALRPEDTVRIVDLLERTVPPNTRKGRKRAALYLEAWHQAHFGEPLRIPSPPETVVAFIIGHYEGLPAAVERALVEVGIKKPGTHSVATIETRLAHWAKAHTSRGFDSPAKNPAVQELRASLRRDRARQGGQRQARAIDRALLDRLVGACLRQVGAEARSADRLRGLRDAALFLCAWAPGGRRRSEVAALEVRDLVEDGDGMVWTLRKSKTDQEGQGLTLWVGARTAAALREWLEAAGIVDGAVFRAIDPHGHLGSKALTGRSVSRILKARARQAGLDPSKLSPHGFRAGFMTEGGKRGFSLQELMRLSGHKDAQTALKYHRSGSVRNDRAASMAE